MFFAKFAFEIATKKETKHVDGMRFVRSICFIH